MILIDGDMLVYRVGFACDEESEKVAIQTMANYISELISDLSEHYDNHKLYLTGSSNFRNEVAVSQPYKGGRPSRKPVHKDLLREYMLDAWKAELSDNMEADDCIAIKSTELEHKSIICSLDKDFLQIPTKIYDYTKKIMKEVDERSATEWLYRQALMGDRERARGPIAMRRGSEEAGDGARACGRFVFFRMTAVLGARLARGGVG